MIVERVLYNCKTIVERLLNVVEVVERLLNDC